MKVAVVDDHVLFRVGVRQTLAASTRYELVGEAGSAREAFKMIEAAAPDILLMDIGLPGMDGVVATREIRRRSPQTRILMMTAYAEINNVLDALDAGAAGFALKTDGPEALLEALARIQRGERYLAPGVADRLRSVESRRRQATDVLSVLSQREREIFRLAVKCLKAREIAQELCIARKTVDQHDGWCAFSCLFIEQRDAITFKLLHGIPPWSNGSMNLIALQWAS